MENQTNLPGATNFHAWPGWQVQQFEDMWKNDPVTPLADYYAARGDFENAVKAGEEAISQLEAKVNSAKDSRRVNARSTDAYCPWFVSCYELAEKIAVCKTAAYCSKIDPERAAKIGNIIAKPGTGVLNREDFEKGNMSDKLEALAKYTKQELYERHTMNWMMSLALFKTED